MEDYEITLWLVEGTRPDGSIDIEEFWNESVAEAHARSMVFVEEVFTSARVLAADMKVTDSEVVYHFSEDDSAG